MFNAQENREGVKYLRKTTWAVGYTTQSVTPNNPRLSALEQRTVSSMFHDPHFSLDGCGNLVETLFILAFSGSILTSCT
jgi:hypothetical protein